MTKSPGYPGQVDRLIRNLSRYAKWAKMIPTLEKLLLRHRDLFNYHPELVVFNTTNKGGNTHSLQGLPWEHS